MTADQDTTAVPSGQVGARLIGALEELGVDHEPGARPEEVVVTLPGERKLRTVCSLVAGRHDVQVRAFVIHNPDENHDQVYRFLLTRNLRLPGLAYAVDTAGDVYLTGRLANAAVTTEAVDRLLGAVLSACDEPFNELLVLGFLTSMRKEWRWRISRGESTANLEAFRPLLEHNDSIPQDDEDDPQ